MGRNLTLEITERGGNLNIGVDVDGVLVELESYQLINGAKFFKKKYGYDVVNPAGFDIMEIFACTEKERKRFWLRYLWRQVILQPARENAAQTLQGFREEGHKLFIVTGRVFVTKRGFQGWLSRTLLSSWLKRRKIPYDAIFYCSDQNSAEDKVLGCNKHGIDIIIEDNAENITALSQTTKVLCFDAAYNRECMGENIQRVRDWEEVREIIKNT